MLKALATAMAFLAFVSAATAQEGAPSRAVLEPEAVRQVVEKAIDGFIRPGYRHFHQEAVGLAADMDALCRTPSPTTLAAARKGFAKAARSWARIEIVRTGPAIEENRLERILFYPDRKSTGLKQVQALLANPDESATQAAGLKGKSVAMQGFGALEFVLAGTGSENLVTAQGDFRCRYGRAVSQNIEELASELVALWDAPDGVQRHWKQPGPDNPLFRTEQEAMTALLGILVHGAEMVRDQRIETFYKGADRPAFPKQAIFWRSQNTWTMVDGNLEGLRDLILTSELVELLPSDQRSIIGSIDFVLKSLSRVVKTLDPDVEAIVGAPAGRQKLDFVLVNGRDLINRLNDDYGSAIGPTSGFSFSDGD